MCPVCGIEMNNLGTKLRIPTKHDLKGWAQLDEFIRAETDREFEEKLRTKELHRSELRTKIKKMRARPETKGRAAEIEKLEAELKVPYGK